MSSFVVNKSEYIKAAGIVAGIAAARSLWIWDYEKHRNMMPEDYHRVFSECYTMNALSVQEQYHDTEPATDSRDYMALFKEYMQKAKAATMRPDRLRENILDLHSFFGCAEYQTEKEPYYFKMLMFFNRINAAMLPLMAPPREVDGWHELTL